MVVVILVASSLIEKGEKFLLIKAKIGVPKGLWNLPGGHLDENETFEEAAIREAKEETGFDIDIRSILCIAHEHYLNNVLIVTFNARINGGSISLPTDEIEDARWFSFDEIMKMSKESITHSAYNSVLAFKESRQIIILPNIYLLHYNYRRGMKMMPKVKKIEPGHIEIDSKVYGEMDLLLHPNGHEDVDKTHKIGITEYDFMMLREPEVLVFGLGFKNEAKLSKDVLIAAKRDKIEVLAMPTPDAIKKFLELIRKGKKAVARIHTTE
ncbi:MAG: MTH938/NDUFAF3 family protein [Candidatus Aenigmarchaeota archaeon]|nr:MTH938/NDUFAF3 family protein [Candidatus Aenigmarchaeota archaeon]MDI6722830.1 MTH938/NDUFAF3 family protein [Candidatus Aenigmarchaeota archaeon]